jgi:hypothetical protein
MMRKEERGKRRRKEERGGGRTKLSSLVDEWHASVAEDWQGLQVE